MTEASVGGFEFNGRSYHFHSATCRIDPPGDLFVQAVGARCELRLAGVPFPGASTAADLPGRSWEPDDDELARHADVFAEGGLTVRGTDYWIHHGRVACKRFDPASCALTVSFRLTVTDGEYGEESEADGVIHCAAAGDSSARN